jgi:hypothetical protein
MIQTFERSGVTFRYPANWKLETDEAGDGWTVTLQSPETAFLLVSLRPDADGPGQVADEALAILKAEYPEMDAEPAVEDLAGLPAIGHDLDFLTLDTAITGWTRSVDTTAGPLLVMWQTSEYDREQNEPVLRAITASLRIEE